MSTESREKVHVSAASIGDRSSIGDEADSHLPSVASVEPAQGGDAEKNVTSAADTGDDSANEEYYQEEWNRPKKNVVRIAATCYSFLVLGMCDSSTGALIPSLEQHYNLSYLVVSVCFIAPFCGYMLAAFLNEHLHRKVGRWGVGLIGTVCQLICFIIAIPGPPFPVYVIAYAIAGFGNGAIDAAWNSWMGSLKQANEAMGLLHGLYGVGGILCPAIFTAMIGAGIKWHYCFGVMIGFTVVSIVVIAYAFWGENAEQYAKTIERAERASGDTIKADNKTIMKQKIVWLVAACLFLYVGAEVATGGWVSTFMIQVRHGAELKMGYVTTGFWAGIAVGRFILGFVTGIIKHEKWLFLVYCGAAVLFQILFWTVPSLIVSAISIGFLGFFLGPLFPTIIVVAVQKLPKSLHVGGIGFAAALGGAGAAVLPFITGAIANSSGAKVMAPFVFALLAVLLLAWLVLIPMSSKPYR